jgi:ubiquinone/menaquinone biosynthesis C-methylase UbiE
LPARKFLDWLDAPKNLKWIDIGCGNGAFTEVLIARCAPAAVTGVDPSEGQLAYARARPGAKRAEFRVADAQALPFPDNSFDAATMALVIVFIPDPRMATRELVRVVRPGGVVATYVWEFPRRFSASALGGGDEGFGSGTAGAAECTGFGARCHASDLERSRAHRDRNRGDPHSRQFFQLRRFLGF